MSIFSNIKSYTFDNNGSVKWVPLLLVFIMVSMILTILVYIVIVIVRQYKNTSNYEPWLIENTSNASDPQKSIDSNLILKSNDQKYGIEFSYSLWFYVDGWTDEARYIDNSGNKMKHVFHRGDKFPNAIQAPGVWLKKDIDSNDLRIVVKMNTFNESQNCDDEDCYFEKCEIGNIPLNKWVHLTIVTINKNIDLYINGFLKKRCLLKGLPRENIGDVYISSFGGFKGYLSRFRYFNYSLPVWKIEQIMKQGPSPIIMPDLSKTIPPYLSYNWWTQKFGIPHYNEK